MQFIHKFNISVVKIIHLQCQNNGCYKAYGTKMGIIGFTGAVLFLVWNSMYSDSSLILFLIHFLNFE